MTNLHGLTCMLRYFMVTNSGIAKTNMHVDEDNEGNSGGSDQEGDIGG